VTAVLEGSLREAGDRLRVTAQLVDARDGYHLWSESFDRELEDVFAIRDEITASIVEALQEEPEAVVGLWVRGLIHSEQDEHEAAIETLTRAAALTHRASFALALLGGALGRVGRRAEALEVLQELQDRKAGDGQFVAPLFFAMVEAHVGREERALDYVEAHVGERHPGPGPLLPAGALDVLRGEPRFDALLVEAELR
jgi:tetratricopeptide (TPR) repeat protein